MKASALEHGLAARALCERAAAGTLSATASGMRAAARTAGGLCGSKPLLPAACGQLPSDARRAAPAAAGWFAAFVRLIAA